MYGLLFYTVILVMLTNAVQGGKMVARLPLFWRQSKRDRLFPGTAPGPRSATCCTLLVQAVHAARPT
jgi:hypothetical protein